MERNPLSPTTTTTSSSSSPTNTSSHSLKLGPFRYLSISLPMEPACSEFWLPPEFLTDDFLVEKENKESVFPYEPSHGFGLESSYGDEESFLSRKMVQSTLEDDDAMVTLDLLYHHLLSVSLIFSIFNCSLWCLFRRGV